MRQREAVFVDSGAWIALALTRDPLHTQAREQWELLQGAGAKLHTSVPVVIETFTFLIGTPIATWRWRGKKPSISLVPSRFLHVNYATWNDRGNTFDAQACISCLLSMPQVLQS
jgi:predicted nucleic acid-binding protein